MNHVNRLRSPSCSVLLEADQILGSIQGSEYDSAFIEDKSLVPGICSALPDVFSAVPRSQRYLLGGRQVIATSALHLVAMVKVNGFYVISVEPAALLCTDRLARQSLPLVADRLFCALSKLFELRMRTSLATSSPFRAGAIAA